METDRWRRVEALYHAALLRKPDERARFLADACGEDEALRHEVESLLRHASDADQFMKTRVTESEPYIGLEVGQRLGPYRIDAPIGAGGMGEVYRARDTKLGRDVAIKVLPETFAGDRTRLARFEREARLLAALNHANIAAIHGLEEAAGQPFLVLELVPGQTLEQIIAARRTLAVPDALPIARQIADALAAAHDLGIVHRDLKPANVKVTPNGQVKVLDFGLAKGLLFSHVDAEPGSADDIRLGEPTETGLVMGTPAYMSPEQARGHSVDGRTDIWAFGCVLFELLTGRRAFAGDTVSDTLARVLEREPDWTALPPATPPVLLRLLRRCLQKDPAKRLHSIADARLDLDDVLAPEAPVGNEVGTLTRVGPRWREAMAWGLVAALVVTAAVLWWRTRTVSSPTSTQNVLRLSEPVAGGLAWGGFFAQIPFDLSRDGSQLVYAAVDGKTTRLFLRVFNRLDTVPIPHTEGASNPFFAPDGRSVGFRGADSKLKVLSLDGGQPSTPCDLPAAAGGTWGPDGHIVFTSTGTLWRVPAAGGKPEQLTKLERAGSPVAPLPVQPLSAHRFPQVLPDGSVLFTISNEEREYWTFLYDVAARRPDGTIKIVMPNASTGRYLPPGYLVFARDLRLMVAPFDLRKLEVTGPAVQVMEGIASTTGGNATFSVSETGVLAYSLTQSGRKTASTGSLVWVDASSGRQTPLPYPPDRYVAARLSRDGQSIAVRIRQEDRGTQVDNVFVGDLARGVLTRLTTSDVRGFTWTHNSQRVTFRRADGSLWWRPLDRSQPEELLADAAALPDGPSVGSWSPDGQTLLVGGVARGGRGHGRANSDIWAFRSPLSQPGGARTGSASPLFETPYEETLPFFSPDGRWIVYAASDMGIPKVYVRPASGFGRVEAVSNDDASPFVWIDRGIVYRKFTQDPTDHIMIVSAETQPELKIGLPRPFADLQGIFQDVTRDGKRILLLKGGDIQIDFDSPRAQVDVVVGWNQELMKKLGAKQERE